MERSVKIVLTVFAVGVILIIAGQSLYRYANQSITDLETQLSQADLSESERDNLQGSLVWWRNAIVSTYGPTSIALIAAGIAVLSILTVYFVLTVRRSPKKPFESSVVDS